MIGGIRQEIKEALKRAIDSTFKINLGCVKDQDGVPIPFYLTHCDLQDDFIVFDTTKLNPAYNLIEKFPEVSLSLIDMESIIKKTNPTGLQVKGLAKKEGQRFKLEIFEIYNVIPQAGIDLNIPIYRKKLLWSQTKPVKTFRFVNYNSSVPQNILNEVVSLRDKAHSQIIPSIVTTIDTSNGVPNISPRWIIEITPSSWIFGDVYKHKTQTNVEKPSAVSILIFDINSGQGIIGSGWTSKSDSPEIRKKVEDFWKTKDLNASAIKINLFHPEEIYRISRISFTKIFESRPRSQWLFQ